MTSTSPPYVPRMHERGTRAGRFLIGKEIGVIDRRPGASRHSTPSSPSTYKTWVEARGRITPLVGRLALHADLMPADAKACTGCCDVVPEMREGQGNVMTNACNHPR